MPPHVLVISTALDQASDRVVASLRAAGVQVTRLDTERFPFESRLTIGPSPTTPYGLALDGMAGPFTSCFYRRVRIPPLPSGMDTGVYDFCIREARAALLGGLLGLSIPFMNHPAKTWAAEFKPYQLRVASSVGLRVPPTVISNNPAAIRQAFHDFGGTVIAKPVRSGYLDVGGTPSAIYTSVLGEEDIGNDDALRLAPAIYQPLIPKHCDVRVTIVGDDVFAASIHSQGDPAGAVDWRRTSDPTLPHSRAALPPDLLAALHRLMAELDLVYGAIDLVETPEHEYVFLEVNPAGEWLWIEDILSYPITASACHWLSNPQMAFQ